MKWKYVVKWYEHNLTVPKNRRFLTEWGAIAFASYIEAYECAKPRITEI